MKPRAIILFGSVMLILGTFLPWVIATRTLSYQQIGLGTLIGIFTFISSLLIVLLNLTGKKSLNVRQNLLMVALGLTTIILVAFETQFIAYNNLHGFDVQYSTGVGIYVSLLGGLLVLIGGTWASWIAYH
jgi:hypothetical protein